MVYKWYILPIGGLYATYHLLGEPETTIEVQYKYKTTNLAILLVPFLGWLSDPKSKVVNVTNPTFGDQKVTLLESPGH